MQHQPQHGAHIHTWLAASGFGFACHCGKPQDACAYRGTMDGLRCTTHSSNHIPHIQCKPEGIRPGGMRMGTTFHQRSRPTLLHRQTQARCIWGINRTQGGGWTVVRSTLSAWNRSLSLARPQEPCTPSPPATTNCLLEP
ncbi:unnamed protein product, partial [Dicrocoelium dendriticum]